MYLQSRPVQKRGAAAEEQFAELTPSMQHSGLPRGSAANCHGRRPGFAAWDGKMPWRRAWQPTPVFLPGESHGQRSPAGCSPWGRRVGHDLASKQQRHDNRAVYTSLSASGSGTLLPVKSRPLMSSCHGGFSI